MSIFNQNQIIQEITTEIIVITGKSVINPFLLLIGGYPGSGKTSLIQKINEIDQVSVISYDQIRQNLLDRKLRGSTYDWEIIFTVSSNLLKKYMSLNYNIILDANAHKKNISLFTDLIDHNYSILQSNNYRILKICLNPPIETLIARIRNRESNINIHQGTEEDLLRDLKSERKQINLNDYALVINNEQIPFETELALVRTFLFGV